ncbi:Sphingoid long-chain base transporter [Wickerhamomyces ciferrii]|uniref:Sphingoid long-chain base transporter RSB1 n=1 Tax=Wickerhamomyces ciferrii (strain ATCC 14091 / BCRC 22168 / CBS 111 / JCM 3599 / NBRC 0793 / NRRL Y-1031 F-60-10) TaxID=1206466 RepID=K0KG11_WICCF|nr:Sphingoid long-chain base transporter [Wickerhamomyces ciferrii]CCH41871.1 Sphingoid long-chain base transporter [Wickerhamomyces ciferrii]
MTSSTTNYVPLITSLGAKVSSYSVKLATQTTTQKDVQATYQSMQASFGLLSNQAIIATATQSQAVASASAAIGEYQGTLKQIFDAQNQYGEIPSIGGNLTYLVIFAILFLSQSLISSWYKQWWFFVAMFCGLALETMGFLGRFLSHDDATVEDYFLLQIIALTIAPAFIMGGIYILLGKFIVVYGPKFAVMRPILYSYLFMICDFISLVIQAIGGALAASAETKKDNETEYQGKFNQNPDYIKLRSRTLFKIFPFAVALSVLFVYIRCVYRLIELIQGWSGYLITHEIYMFFLDALMIALATFVLLIFHPGIAFNSRKVTINVVGTKKSGKTKKEELAKQDDEGINDQSFEDQNDFEKQKQQGTIEYDGTNPGDSSTNQNNSYVDEKPDTDYEDVSLQNNSLNSNNNPTNQDYSQFTNARDESWRDIRQASERRDFTQS